MMWIFDVDINIHCHEALVPPGDIPYVGRTVDIYFYTKTTHYERMLNRVYIFRRITITISDCSIYLPQSYSAQSYEKKARRIACNGLVDQKLRKYDAKWSETQKYYVLV